MGPMHLPTALRTKPSTLVPTLLLVVGLIAALGAAAYGYLESRRTEPVLIAVRAVPYGQPLVADDLALIELPLHRPAQLAGMGDPARVIGKWAAREIGPNDLVQPTMLLDRAPDQPVYPSGQQLDRDTVAVPFATDTIGPLTFRDRVNVGYNDPTGDRQACLARGGTAAAPEPAPDGSAAAPEPAPDGTATGRPFACRMVSRVKVLWVDEAASVAFLQMTPYQAHAVRSLQAANMQLWGERYGATSDELPALDRLDVAQIAPDRLTMSITDTLRLYDPQGYGGAIPGTDSPIPGAPPTAAPPAP